MRTSIRAVRAGALALCAAFVVATPSPAWAGDGCTVACVTLPVIETAHTTVELAEDTVDDTKETLESLSKVVEEAADDTLGKTGKIVKATTSTVDETVETVERTVNSLTVSPTSPSEPSPNRHRKRGHEAHKESTPAAVRSRQVMSSGQVIERMGAIPERRPAPVTASSYVTAPSVLDRIIAGAAEATKRLAFPLMLTLLVVAFLALQGRLDRRDPKLALAPVDSRQDFLAFE